MKPIESVICTVKKGKSDLRVYSRDVERFWKGVKKDDVDGCWEWTKTRDKDGYGVFSLDDYHVLAHRFIFTINNGAILDGLQILHRCDNTSCVRPEHLFSGTHMDNIRDKMAKGRGKITHRERHSMSPLNPESVREIRKAYEAGSTQRELAAKFGMRRSSIGKVVRGERWSYIK